MSTRKINEDRQQQLDRYAPLVAALLGLVGSTWFFVSAGWGRRSDDSLFLESAADWEKAVIAVPATAAFVVTSWCMARWFERTVLKRASAFWNALLWGAGAGIIAGAAITTSGWLVTLAMGEPMGVIDSGTVGAAGYLAVLGMSIVSGAFWGALVGVIPGAVIGTGIHLYASR